MEFAYEVTPLRELDINVAPASADFQSGTCELPLPKRIQRSKKQLQNERIEARLAEPQPLPFREVHRLVSSFLEYDFDSVEEYERLRSRGLARDLPERFYGLLQRGDDEAQRTIAELKRSWNEMEVPMRCSGRIMDFLHVKRRVLREGLEFPFQDFLDWLLLAALLEESVTSDIVIAFSRDLGPCNRAKVEQVLTSYALTRSSLCPVTLYLVIKKVRPVLDDASSITGYYFNVALDTFIEEDERTVGVTLLHDSDITLAMRAKLCEWLYETYAGTTVHRPVRQETYFLGIALLDRFLAVRPVARSSFLLCGCAAVLLASKHEEIYSPTLQRVVNDAQMTFTEHSLAEMERQLAATLNFSLSVPTVSHIANTMLVDQDPPATPIQQCVLLYLLVALSIHTHHGQYHQALLAAAAIHISRNVCGVPTKPASNAVRSLVPRVLEATNALSHPNCRIFAMFEQKRLHEASRLVREYSDVCSSHAEDAL